MAAHPELTEHSLPCDEQGCDVLITFACSDAIVDYWLEGQLTAHCPVHRARN